LDVEVSMGENGEGMDKHTLEPVDGGADGRAEQVTAPEAESSPAPDASAGAAQAPQPATESGAPASEPAAPSPAWVRFTSCRWHHAAEGATPAYCTHRDVFPLAGVHGFNPESWCPDCPYYKLRRTVRRPATY
jgi:hypothetical protein